MANVAPSAGRRRTQDLGGPLVPTLGGAVSYTGVNLGGFGLTSNVFASLDASLLSAAPLGVLNFTQSQLVLSVPPGDGVNHTVSIVVAGQSSNAVILNYAPPTVDSVSPQFPSGLSPAAGNFVVTVQGSNFGVTAPNITINGVSCPVVLPFVPSAGHNVLTCIAPDGAGRDLPVVVSVSGQSSAVTSAATFRYTPPRVFSVWPTNASTSGRWLGAPIPGTLFYSPGPRVVCTIIGRSFFTNGTLEFRDRAVSPSTVFSVPPADILSWNDTTIVFYVPPGYGANLYVVPIVGGQTPADYSPSPDPPALFSYNPPSVLAIGRADRQLIQCAPISSCYSDTSNGGNATLCTLVPAQCFDTAGNYPVQVIGQSFGGQNANVTIGGRLCPLSSSSTQADDLLVCSMPQGYGDANDVVVSVGGRRSAPINFAYDEPIVTSITPSTPDANGVLVT